MTKHNEIFLGLKREYVFLGLIILFHCIGNALWLYRDGSNIVALNEDIHFNNLISFYEEFLDLTRSASSPLDLVRHAGTLLENTYKCDSITGVDKSRLIFLAAVPFIYILGFSVFLVKCINIFYFVILMCSVYFIGKIIKDEKTGLWAAFLVSLYPGILGASRGYSHEFPLVAFTSAAICLLMYSRYFTRIIPTLSLGIILGLGILMKPQIIFFVSFPILIVFLVFLKRWYRRQENVGISTILGLVGALVFFLAISSFWWKGNIAAIVQQFSNIAIYPGGASTFSLEDVISISVKGEYNPVPIRYYLKHGIIPFVSWPFLILFLIGLFSLLFFKKRVNVKESILFMWIAVPLGLFSCLANRCPKYVFPLLPAIGLLSVHGLSYIHINSFRYKTLWLKYKKTVCMAIIGLCVIHYIYFSWFYTNEKYYWVRKPAPLRFTEQTLAAFEDELETVPQDRLRVGIVRREGVLGGNELTFLKYLLRKKFIFSAIEAAYNPYRQFFKYYDTFDYIIVVDVPRSRECWLKKDYSNFKNIPFDPPLSTVYMWQHIYRREGRGGFMSYGKGFDIWIDRQGVNDFLSRIAYTPLKDEIAKLADFVAVSKEYRLVAQGKVEFLNEVYPAYLLKKP
ncbi:MAG: glycosyltransferase family 39 protein [Candidatus Omnitrophica bacterium]|nr:glycosyltransferase family 39 protein [Candidatus Omnitrophota bacterium]